MSSLLIQLGWEEEREALKLRRLYAGGDELLRSPARRLPFPFLNARSHVFSWPRSWRCSCRTDDVIEELPKSCVVARTCRSWHSNSSPSAVSLVAGEEQSALHFVTHRSPAGIGRSFASNSTSPEPSIHVLLPLSCHTHDRLR